VAETDRAGSVFDDLVAAGAVPCGLGARDTLRLEMGYPLWGRDLDTTTTPLEAGLDWVVAWDHEFVGKEALLSQRSAGPRRALIGFALDDRRVPRHGYGLRCDGSSGTVTSGNFSPTLGVGIGMGYVAPPSPPGAAAMVEMRGEWFPARRVHPPFVKR
jgi:aminomethyltransferase